MFPSGGRLARGGGNPEPALIHVLAELKAVKGASVGHCTLDAKPLPTTRPRLFFFVGTQGTDGEALAREAESLSEALRALPQHHLASFWLAQEASGAKASSPDDSSGVTAAMRVKEYHAAFAVSLNKAVQKKRLPADITPGPDAERPSMTHSAYKLRQMFSFSLARPSFRNSPRRPASFLLGGVACCHDVQFWLPCLFARFLGMLSCEAVIQFAGRSAHDCRSFSKRRPWKSHFWYASFVLHGHIVVPLWPKAVHQCPRIIRGPWLQPGQVELERLVIQGEHAAAREHHSCHILSDRPDASASSIRHFEASQRQRLMSTLVL